MGEGEQDFEIKVPLPPWERDLGRGFTEYAFALTTDRGSQLVGQHPKLPEKLLGKPP
jgi:hypothetical protein